LLPVFEGRHFLSGQDYNHVHAFSDQPARDTPKQIHKKKKNDIDNKTVFYVLKPSAPEWISHSWNFHSGSFATFGSSRSMPQPSFHVPLQAQHISISVKNYSINDKQI